MAKWAVKLSEYDISYLPRPAMKVQVLADFLVECTANELHPEEGWELLPAEAGRPSSSAEAESPAETARPSNPAEEEPEMTPANTWTLHVDEASRHRLSSSSAMPGVLAWRAS